ncbi:hypothetical protein [Streptomyces microflavus]|uniref:hypothetical protein n=1 Tax=Streptomyces microflavus TaxID=1919 RepID=UPI003245E091
MPNPTPADRPTEELAAAARKLRAACLAVGDPDHPGLPWHAERCGHKDRGECACIVAQGRTAEGSGPVTALHYIADTEHPDLAAYIALMHPGVGLALAAWLEREAEIWQVIDDASAHPEETGLKVTIGASTHAEALAVARQLLGTTEAEGEPDEQEPVQLRWGLDDVMYGDDDTTTMLLSGPGREPYWVELDPERTAALRDALAGPAAPPAPADRAAVLAEVDWIVEHCPDHGCVEPETAVCHCEIADRLRRLADDAAAGVQQTTTSEESDGTALRRYARRMAALDRLCSGRPGYHTVTVKQVLTAMSDADDKQPAAPAAPEEPTPVAWSSVGSLLCTTCCDGHPDYRAARVMSLPKGGTCDGCGARISATTDHAAPEEPTR